MGFLFSVFKKRFQVLVNIKVSTSMSLARLNGLHHKVRDDRVLLSVRVHGQYSVIHYPERPGPGWCQDLLRGTLQNWNPERKLYHRTPQWTDFKLGNGCDKRLQYRIRSKFCIQHKLAWTVILVWISTYPRAKKTASFTQSLSWLSVIDRSMKRAITNHCGRQVLHWVTG